MGQKIRKVLEAILITILSYLVIANITHFITIRTVYESPLNKDHTAISIMHQNYNTLSKNITILKDMVKTNHFNEDEFRVIVKTLEQAKKEIDNSKFMTFPFSEKFNDIKLMDMLYRSGEIKNLNIIQAYDTVIKHDPDCGFRKDEIVNTYIRIIYSLGNIQNQLMDNYQYHTQKQGLTTALATEPITIIINTSDKIKLMVDLSNYFVKDGSSYE